MKLFRADCEDCGVFQLEEPPSEIIYVNYSRNPKVFVDCPSCKTTVTSHLDRATAEIYEQLGVAVKTWETPLTPEQIDNFLVNFETELGNLLSQ